MRSLDLRAAQPTRTELRGLVPRAAVDVAVALDAARALVDDVRERGEAALLEQAERLDGVRPEQVRIHGEQVGAAVRALDPVVRDALEEAIARVRA
ncbi:MAG TPA: histidinol dehydrogenase, partial [Rhodoglobus sp.]|nr:histidinol dehydrogenase [Rhodoglobus sp.]